MSANLNKKVLLCKIKAFSNCNNLPKKSTAEVSRIVVSPENAAKLGIENVLHLDSVW